MRTRLAPALLAATLAFSCSGSNAGREWVRLRPATDVHLTWEAIPADRIHEVQPDLREEAIKLLEAEAGRMLRDDEARRFMQGRAFNTSGRRWFLLRAVRTPAEDGKFAVMTRGRAVTVRYEAVSRKDETIKSALVVDLDSSPESVYVEISTAR